MAQVQAMQTRVKKQQTEVTQTETQTLPQVVATNGPHSTVMQAVDQQQSFEMVQTLFMSSVFHRPSVPILLVMSADYVLPQLANLAYLRLSTHPLVSSRRLQK